MKKLVLLLILLSLCLMIYPSISGAISFEGFGGKVALVLPSSPWSNTIGFGAIGSLGSILPQMPALKAEVSAEYWGSTYDFLGISNYFSYSNTWTSVSFNGTAKYYFTTGGGVLPFAGGGLGLVFSRDSVSWKYPGYAVGNVNTSSTNLNLGVHLVGGVDIPVGSNMKFVAEGKYATGGANSIQLSGGLVVKLE